MALDRAVLQDTGAGFGGVRGPAAVAQTLYRETDESRELRLKVAEERWVMMQAEGVTEKRPSKRDRRLINRFRGRG